MTRNGYPLFDSNCEIGTLFKIFELLGTPTKDTWPDVESLEHFANKPFPKWKQKSLHRKEILPAFYNAKDYIGSNVVAVE